MSHLTGRAIVSHDALKNKGWKLDNVRTREPQEGELLVEMVATGVCHTDILTGYEAAGENPIAFYPRILGHEGAGYVRAVGPGVTVAAEGDPVLLSYAFCNDCALCKANKHSHCLEFDKRNFGGPFPDFGLEGQHGELNISGNYFGQSSFSSISVVRQCSVVNVKGLVKDKKDLSLFAPLGCGIQTGAGTVVNAAKATPDDSIVVLGQGGVGLSCILGAAVAGCKTIIGVDIVESRLKLSKELGATHTLNSKSLPDGAKTLTEAVYALTDGIGATIVIDTTGVPALINEGFAFTRNCGKYVQVGSAPFDFELKIPLFGTMLSGKQILGAIEGQVYPPEFVPKMIQWYREGRFPIDRLVKFMDVEEWETAVKEMHDGVTIKPVLLF